MGPGVKGRPQACLTCRRRKKGCDLQRPACGQCRKACIPCEGYTSNPPLPAGAVAGPGAPATTVGVGAGATPATAAAAARPYVPVTSQPPIPLPQTQTYIAQPPPHPYYSHYQAQPLYPSRPSPSDSSSVSGSVSPPWNPPVPGPPQYYPDVGTGPPSDHVTLPPTTSYPGPQNVRTMPGAPMMPSMPVMPPVSAAPTVPSHPVSHQPVAPVWLEDGPPQLVAVPLHSMPYGQAPVHEHQDSIPQLDPSLTQPLPLRTVTHAATTLHHTAEVVAKPVPQEAAQDDDETVRTAHERQKLARQQKGRKQNQQQLQRHLTNYQQQQIARKSSANSSISFVVNLAKSGEDYRFIFAFWEDYLPRGEAFPTSQGAFNYTLPEDTVKDLALGGSALHKTSLALGLSTIGKREKNKVLLEAGARMYHEAVHQLATAVVSKQQWVEELLPVPRQLSTWENMFGGDEIEATVHGQKTLMHCAGEAAIMANASPASFITGRSHRLFVSARHHLVLLAYMQRKRTFLSDPAWKTIPWTGREKTPQDLLMDIVVDLPSVIEGFQLMEGEEDPEKTETYRLLLRRAAYDISNRILDWHDHYALPIALETLDSPLPETLTHEAVGNAHIMSLYWGVCIRLYSLHLELNRPGEPLEDRFDMKEIVGNVIRAIFLLRHDDTGTYRTHLVGFPLSSALQYVHAAVDDDFEYEKARIWEMLYHPNYSPLFHQITSLEPEAQPSVGYTKD